MNQKIPEGVKLYVGGRKYRPGDTVPDFVIKNKNFDKFSKRFEEQEKMNLKKHSDTKAKKNEEKKAIEDQASKDSSEKENPGAGKSAK